MSKLTSLPLLVLLLQPLLLPAQEDPPPRGNFTAEFIVAGSDGVTMSTANTPDEDMRTTEYAFELEYALPLDEHGRRVLSFGLELTRDEFEGGNLGWLLPETLTSIAVEASYLHVFNDRWLALAEVGVSSLGTGDTAWSSDGTGVQGLALARYTASPTFNSTFGVYLDSLGLGGDKLNPVLGVEWLPAPRWRLALGVPFTGVFYQWNERWEISLQASYRSDVFALQKKDRLARGWSQDADLEYEEIRTGLRVHWRLAPRAQLQFEIGAVLLRELEFHHDGARQKFESDGVDGGYARLGYSFNF